MGAGDARQRHADRRRLRAERRAWRHLVPRALPRLSTQPASASPRAPGTTPARQPPLQAACVLDRERLVVQLPERRPPDARRRRRGRMAHPAFAVRFVAAPRRGMVQLLATGCDDLGHGLPAGVGRPAERRRERPRASPARAAAGAGHGAGRGTDGARRDRRRGRADAGQHRRCRRRPHGAGGRQHRAAAGHPGDAAADVRPPAPWPPTRRSSLRRTASACSRASSGWTAIAGSSCPACDA